MAQDVIVYSSEVCHFWSLRGGTLFSLCTAILAFGLASITFNNALDFQ